MRSASCGPFAVFGDLTSAVLALGVLAACDAGAKPEPARERPRDCAAVVATLRVIAGHAGSAAPSEASARALEASCRTAPWPDSLRACLVASADPEHVRACTKLHPQVIDELLLTSFEAAASSADAAPITCDAVLARIGEAFFAWDPKAAPMTITFMPTLRTSCAEDGWPEPLKACILAASPQALAKEHACEPLVPKALADKLSARFGTPLSPNDR